MFTFTVCECVMDYVCITSMCIYVHVHVYTCTCDVVCTCGVVVCTYTYAYTHAHIYACVDAYVLHAYNSSSYASMFDCRDNTYMLICF